MRMTRERCRRAQRDCVRPLLASARRGNPRGLPRQFADRMYDDFDRDTRRAVLRLYRAAAASRCSGFGAAVAC